MPPIIIVLLVIFLIVVVVCTIVGIRSTLKLRNPTDKRTRKKVIAATAGGYSSVRVLCDHSGKYTKKVVITQFGSDSKDVFFNKYGYRWDDIRGLVKQNSSYALKSKNWYKDIGRRLTFFINEDLFLIFPEKEFDRVLKTFDNENCYFEYVKTVLFRKDWIYEVMSSIVEEYGSVNKVPNAFNAALGGELFGPTYAVGELLDSRHASADIVKGEFQFAVKSNENQLGFVAFHLDMDLFRNKSASKAFVTFLRFNQFINEFYDYVEIKAKPWDV